MKHLVIQKAFLDCSQNQLSVRSIQEVEIDILTENNRFGHIRGCRVPHKVVIPMKGLLVSDPFHFGLHSGVHHEILHDGVFREKIHDIASGPDEVAVVDNPR